jgi:uncharacterized damage-inducible protein DinB
MQNTLRPADRGLWQPSFRSIFMADAFCDNYRFLARYNRWINERLYEACDALTDEARKQDRGAFFGSIHRTLGHLLVADQVWLRRFAQMRA